MRTIKKTGKSRTESFKDKQYTVQNVAISYDISRYEGKPLRELQWQGGLPNMYSKVELPSHKLNTNGEKYNATVKIQSQARRVNATSKVESVRKSSSDGDNANSESDSKGEKTDTNDEDATAREAAALKIQAAERRREAVKEASSSFV